MTWVGDLPRVVPIRPDKDIEPPHIVAGRAWIAIRALYRAHGQLTRLEGDHLGQLLQKRWYGQCGYSSFRDFVREEFQLSPRTARRRVALSRLVGESPELASALDAGRLSPCQILALSRLRHAPDLSSWIAMAEDCTVRDLEQLVTNYVSDLSSAEGEEAGELVHEETVEDERGRRVTFSAPVSAVVAWQHGLDMAQKVLGWDAPPYRCIEAVLEETAVELAGNDSAQPAEVPEPPTAIGDDFSPVEVKRYPPESLPDFNPTRAQLEALQRAIKDANDEIKSLASKTIPCEDDLDRSIAALVELRRKDRSLRLLMARLLREADAAGVFPFLGYRTVTEFLVARLKISERTASRMRSESWTFEDNPNLVHAFSTGRIGLGQAYLVNRVAVSSMQKAFIRRAETVTYLQFDREVRFLERLADFVPSVAQKFHGPLPLPGLPSALIQRLRDLGWNEPRIENYLESFDFGGDPAVNPILMDRLEGLLDLVALALEEHDLGLTGELPTLATSAEDRRPETPASVPGQSGSLPMLATLGGSNSPPLRTTISFWAPESLIARWNAALERVQLQHGPMPIWAAALRLMRSVVEEWQRVDPSRRPAEWKIFERDAWRCAAPGCSSRRRLEAHHIIFRSQNGSDDPENLITLCHAHHRHGIHDSHLHVEGTAPGRLRWRLGVSKHRVFHGSQRVTGS